MSKIAAPTAAAEPGLLTLLAGQVEEDDRLSFQRSDSPGPLRVITQPASPSAASPPPARSNRPPSPVAIASSSRTNRTAAAAAPVSVVPTPTPVLRAAPAPPPSRSRRPPSPTIPPPQPVVSFWLVVCVFEFCFLLERDFSVISQTRFKKAGATRRSQSRRGSWR